MPLLPTPATWWLLWDHVRKKGRWIQRRLGKRQVRPGAILGMPLWRLTHPTWKVRWEKMNQEYVLTFWANRSHPACPQGMPFPDMSAPPPPVTFKFKATGLFRECVAHKDLLLVFLDYLKGLA